MQKYLESHLAPQTALETLKVQTELNTKKETYFEAIELMNRALANYNYAIRGIAQDSTHRTRGANFPTEVEVNTCYAKLWIYSGDERIQYAYSDFFSMQIGKKPFMDMFKFIDLIRSDLATQSSSIISDSNNYHYMQVLKIPNH